MGKATTSTQVSGNAAWEVTMTEVGMVRASAMGIPVINITTAMLSKQIFKEA